jgi:hypothetical protein
VQPQTPAAESEQVPRPPPGPARAPIGPPTTEHRTDGLRLHVAAAARRVGVAPSTLRTWDRRYGGRLESLEEATDALSAAATA